MDVRKALSQRRLVFDGGTGTLLQQLYGLRPGEPPESFNITRSEAITETHKQYLAAGADIISANTFGVYAHKYDNADELIEAALRAARAAVEQARRGWVALDMGPTGRLLAPMGDLGFEEAYTLFYQSAKRGADCGADLIIIETMADLYEMKAAVLAAKAAGLPVFATMTFDERGRTLTGADPACMATLLNGLGVDAMGMNCGYGPTLYRQLLPALYAEADTPLIMQPNAGLPIMENGVARYDLSPDDFAAQMADMAAQGVWVLGGCCGTTPAHIEALCKRLHLGQSTAAETKPAAETTPATKTKPTAETTPATKTKPTTETTPATETKLYATPYATPCKTQPPTVCAGSKIVRLDAAARDAICHCTETDPDALADEAMELAEDADMLAIFVENPQAVTAVQEMVRVPLLLDAATPETLLAAVRLYNGRPAVNAESRAFGSTAQARQNLTDALLAYGAVIS